ncbi:MAG: esterase, partial [Bacteroidales bacterium]|nr:esterase [Bacteroidales bacterium]
MAHRILFIHGLASSGKYKMADQLRILIKEAEVLSPDVPFEPSEALPFLQHLCDEYKPDLIVGHSLGGFWAQKLRGWRKA